ncbi:MAG: hypothetical protein AAF590_13025 [Pseudomonadota bacterium]
MSGRRIVLHAPTAASLSRARSNAVNILAADPTAAVEIVVNAQGAREAIENNDRRTAPLMRYCANSLEKQDLEVPNDGTIVSSAVVYLADRQAEGWVYIRA